jgi:signal transduction histidine kinase
MSEGSPRAPQAPGSTAEHDEWVRTTFLRRVAHDIVGGAGVARGALDEIERSAGEPRDDRALIAIAKRAITKLERIGRRLRLVGLAEAGELVVAKAAVDLRDVIDQAVAEASELDGRRTVKVERIRADAPLIVQADAEQLRIALSEVVANAIRFARARVRVIERRTESDTFVVIVEDDGPGFPDSLYGELRPRLRSREGQRGMGASLPVVLDIAELHGGTLEIRRAEWEGAERGARVSISLPTA